MNCKCVHCAMCISAVALAISIVALCNSHPRTLGFDYLGLLVGILALLVTALIGWQIVQFIFARTTVEGMIDSFANSISEDFGHVVESLVTLMDSKEEAMGAYYLKAIDMAFQALQKLSECKDARLQKPPVLQVLSVLKSYFASCAEKGELRILVGKRALYMSVLEQYDNYLAKEVAQYVSDSAEETEARDSELNAQSIEELFSKNP